MRNSDHRIAFASLLLAAAGCVAPTIPRLAQIEPAAGQTRIDRDPLHLPLDLTPIAGPPVSDGMPPGEMLIDGILFHIAGGAVDVGRSMSGMQEPVRVKQIYLDPKRSADDGKLSVKVPADAYEALHLLASSKAKPGTVPRMTVRIGVGGFSAIYEDVRVEVPDTSGGGAAMASSRLPVSFASGERGQIYHLRVPLGGTAQLQGLKDAWEVEFTRDVSVHVALPDPSEFALVPAGSPSGVKIFAATLARSPLVAQASGRESGNIYYEGTPVAFDIRVSNRGARESRGTVRVRCAGPGTAEERNVARAEWSLERNFSVKAAEATTLTLDLTPPSGKRGWYEARLEAVSEGQVLQAIGTSFAVLAPDTRLARGDSPFGVWSFFRSHNVVNPPDLEERLGSIMKKGGWRYTYGGGLKGDAAGKQMSKEEAEAAAVEAYRGMLERDGVRFTIQSPPKAYQREEGWFDEKGFEREVVPWLAMARARGYDPFYKVLHESRSSKDLVTRFPEILGGPSYAMPEEELARLEAQIAHVTAYNRALKASDPEAKVVLINDHPEVGIEYMKRGFPKDAFDVFGSEGANFMREPERQPDWLSLLGGLRTWRLEQKRYGYADKPLWMTEALYHGTNPGNLTLHRQAVIYVREAMLALANGVERLAATGVLVDSSDDYTWSNWGSVGFCFRAPVFNPKPSFAMYSWMTQVLDRKKFSRVVPGGGTSLHVLDFADEAGNHVYPVWVVRGAQDLRFRVSGGTPRVSDAYGNPVDISEVAGLVSLRATENPAYITGALVEGIASRTPVELPREAGQILVDFDDGQALEIVRDPSAVLGRSWAFPMVKGDFDVRFGRVDGESALEVRLKPDEEPRKLFSRYVELSLKQPVTLPGRPGALTARVKGNGGWGRVMFELADAEGRVWNSSGNPSPVALNSFDTRGDSFVSFDGWQTMQIPLPGQYPGEDQFVAWPRNYDWHPSGTPECAGFFTDRRMAVWCALGIAPVSYPLKLTRVIVAMMPHVLYVNDEVPVENPMIAIDWLGVVVAPAGM